MATHARSREQVRPHEPGVGRLGTQRLRGRLAAAQRIIDALHLLDASDEGLEDGHDAEEEIVEQIYSFLRHGYLQVAAEAEAPPAPKPVKKRVGCEHGFPNPFLCPTCRANRPR